MLIGSLDRPAWSPTLVLEHGAGDQLAERARTLDIPMKTLDRMRPGLGGAARIPALVRMLRRERPDVFHAQLSCPSDGTWALTAAAIARVPAVIATVRMTRASEINNFRRLQLRALAAGVGRFIAVSRDTERQLVERVGLPADKIDVVHDAARVAHVAVPKAARLRARQLLGPARHIAVLSLARGQNGNGVLLEAAAGLPGTLFAFAGGGAEREQLMAEATALGVSERVVILGSRVNVPELVAACDVFALPSPQDGSSLAILEAMSAGRPIVSSAAAATDELLVDGETGLLVPPGDPGALRDALRRLFADGELRRSLGAHALERSAQFTPQAVTERVTRIYRQVLREASEGERSRELRLGDWRFLLTQTGRPQALNLAGGELAAETELVADTFPSPAAGTADLVVASAPDAQQIKHAASALRPGGEFYAEWHSPLPGRPERARRELELAGFEGVRFYWRASRAKRRGPGFWAALDSVPAIEHLLSSRPVRTRRDRLGHRAWQLATRTGSVAPLSVVASRRGGAGKRVARPELLLAGNGSGDTAVGLSFGQPKESVVKFARVPRAEAALNREAQVLSALQASRPKLAGLPRAHSKVWRVGVPALVESATHGRPLMSVLTIDTFPRLAADVTTWLIELAGNGPTVARAAWSARLVQAPLETLSGSLNGAMVEGELDAIRRAAGQLPNLPLVFENRDCSPWNAVLTPGAGPTLLNWDSAEPRGLPLLDLVYFLATSALVVENAVEVQRARAAYARLLNPATRTGRVAADCIKTYCAELGIAASAVPPLRLLTWILHTHSDFLPLERDLPATPVRTAFGPGVFLGLVREELSLRHRPGGAT